MKNEKLFGIILMLCMAINLAGQKIEYKPTTPVVTDNFRITIIDVIADDEMCKLKMVLENTSDNYFYLYDVRKTGFNFPKLGVYFPTKIREMVVAPNERRSRVAKVEDNDYRSPEFSIQVQGLYKGLIPEEALEIPAFSIKENIQNHKSPDLRMEMEEPKRRKGTVTSTIIVSFSGEENELIAIDPTKIEVKTDDGDKVYAQIDKNKLLALRPGKKIKFKISYKEVSESTQIVWADALKLVEIELEEVEDIKVSK